MRIDVVGRDLDVRDEAKARCEETGTKLTKYFDRTQQITYTLSRANDHEFHAECIVDVETHDDFVAHGRGETLIKAIDDATHKATRQLTDFKEKLKLERR
ncbi:MAG: HPF/RaiA family ribosome-associated protein [Planctomycetota bacterium]